MTFFECQTELPQPFPEAADADLHIVFRQEPGLQFGKRRIGFAHNAGTKSFVIRSKLWLGAACPGTGARLSRLLPTSQNFVDIGHADPEDGRSGISARSRIHCRHHPFAQVLRVSSPHTVPPSNQRREGIKNSAPMEYASDSINSEGALGSKNRACDHFDIIAVGLVQLELLQALSNPGDALALEVTQDSPSGIVAGRACDAAKARRS